MSDTSDVEAEQFVRSIAEDAAAKMIMGSGNFPEPMDKDSLLKFMRNVIDEKDNKKMVKSANFREEEVGRSKTPVLAYVQYGSYADSEGYDVVGEYLRTKAGNIAAVSLGRKAKLLDTLFTQRREMKNIASPKTTVKKGWLSTTEVKEGEA